MTRSVAVFFAVGAVLVSAGRLRTAQSEEPEAKEPEGSKLIKGPDCGKVKQIIPKYNKAARVGTVAGKARGGITNADAAAEEAKVSATRAREIGAVVGEDGKPPMAVDSAAKSADDAAKAATDASKKLDTKLTAFKDSVSGSEFSGADVKDSSVSDLKKLTEDANKKAKDAREAAKRVLEKAEDAEAEALKDTANVEKFTGEFLETAGPSAKNGKELAQKAGWAVDDAEAEVKKAEDAATKVGEAAADAGDQKPVLEAFKSKLEGEKDGVTEAADAVKESKGDLEKKTEALEKAMEPVEKAQQTAKGGNAVHDVQKDLSAAETALDENEVAITDTNGKVTTLDKRQKKLQGTLDEADKKTKK